MSPDDLQVGDLVNVPGGMHGTIRYLGVVAGKQGRFAGIELSSEYADRGKNNGDVDGRRYFRPSAPGSGIFVPINNGRYVTKRVNTASNNNNNSSSNGNGNGHGPSPPTPSPSRSATVNFSKSIGPGSSAPRPRIRQVSMPRDAPTHHHSPPPKVPPVGLRTPSLGTKHATPSPNGHATMTTRPRSPTKTTTTTAPSRGAPRPPSRAVEAEAPMYTAMLTPKTPDPKQASAAAEVAELKEHIKALEQQQLERDRQLDEQAATLAEFQRTMEDLEGSDALSIRAQLREKNEKIAQLTAEFDSHRADFRSTLDTLEIAASETERVYEQRLEELASQNKGLSDHGEDMEIVAGQLKQLEDLVSELEEGLEDARRGEADARAEAEFLRGEVERMNVNNSNNINVNTNDDNNDNNINNADGLPAGSQKFSDGSHTPVSGDHTHTPPGSSHSNGFSAGHLGPGTAATTPVPQRAAPPPASTPAGLGLGLGLGLASGSGSGSGSGSDALKGMGSLLNGMSPVAGKASGVIDESKWCALCERDGHESIDCPFDE